MNKISKLLACIIILSSLMLSGCASVTRTETNVDILQQNPDALMNGMSFALCYSEYRTGQHPDLGKGAVYPSEEEILEDLQILTRNSNFGLIRIYNSGVSSERVLKVIKENKINVKVLLGAWLGAEFSNHEGCGWLSEPITQDYLDMVTGWNKLEILNTIRLANQYKDIVIAVNVGNEVMVSWTDHMVPIENMIAYLRQVRKAVSQPVTVADQYTTWIEHGQKLADEVDFLMVHAYALWGGKDIDEGMSFTIKALTDVRKKIPKGQIILGEIGWATMGTELGDRASEQKQVRFYHEIKKFAAEKNITTFFFEAFDEDWKGNNEELQQDMSGAEKHWGIFTVDRKAKPVMYDLYPDLHPEKQINDIISKMTLDEKIRYLGGTGFISGKKIGETYPIERLGLPVFKMTDATLGSKMTKGATLFPAYICQAAAFNEELAYQYGKAVAQQCVADGYRILLGPGVNIYRVPNCGRNFEYSGEDPYLAARTVVEYIKGVQDNGVIATVKHFVANNTDHYRRNSNSVVSERALREIYFPAFKAAVKEAKVKAVMTSYNQINGSWAAQNKWLITDVLRNEWGFNHLVMSDWWGVNNTELLISSGTDIEMPDPNYLAAPRILPLLKSGKVTEDYIDTRVSNILRPCMEMGLLDNPHQDTTMRSNWPQHAEVAKKIARQGLVLLKNENVLPLDRAKTKSIALVGTNAEKTKATGGGAAGFNPGADFITYAQAIKNSAGENINVYTATPNQTKDADIALVFAVMLETENMDRPFDFDADTIDMINNTAAENPNTIVVVSLGGAVDMMTWLDNVKGLIYAWYPGTYGAVALGEMLFGDLNPSGKLPITLEKRPEDTHYYGNFLPKGTKLSRKFLGWDISMPQYDVNYREGVLVGYRWFDTKKIEPLFPFGFGLSYTTFKFDDIKLSSETLSGDDKLTVTFKLTNTGKLAGAQVAQLYVNDVKSSVIRPAKELKGFKKVFLEPGQTETVSMTLDKKALSFWDSDSGNWKVEPGKFKILLGSSSRDIEQIAEFIYK